MKVQLLDSSDETVPARAPPPDFSKDLVAIIPHLRAFARMLCGRRSVADDLTQEALAKAWRSRDAFEPGTNLKAWVFTILRNEFYSQMRRGWREAGWDEEKGAAIAGPGNAQQSAVDLGETARAMTALPDSQREALILVGAGGFTYEEASAICGTRTGTIKSRVARARVALHDMLDGRTPLPARASASPKEAHGDIMAQLNALSAAPSVGAGGTA